MLRFGWEAILKYIQNKLRAPVKAELSKTKKCLPKHAERNESTKMSLIIKENTTRYSAKRVPEERRLTKFNQAANLDESSASKSTNENYDRYPPSDHSATHGEERLSDNTSLTEKSNMH